MNDPKKIDYSKIEKVYAEASQWVRLCNQVIWGVGSLFVPTSAAALWIAMSMSNSKNRLAIALFSIFLFASWVAILRIYATSSQVAREALIHIEAEWALSEHLRFYSKQDAMFKKRWNVKTLQLAMFGILLLAWIIVFLDLK